MQQGFTSQHFSDEQGRPEGGHTFGTGFAIAWQRGPLGRDETRQPPNGAFVEDIIAAAVERITFYQQSEFQCVENEKALNYLTNALRALEERTKAREARAVEGTHGR